MCVYQYQNGDAKFSSFGALGRQCVSIPKKMSNKNTYLSSYWVEGKRKDLPDDNMSAVLKFATTSLNYLSLKGISVERADTHSLRAGGDNTLLLSGYIDRDIQKMGRRREGNFKEYLQEELYFFTEGMSTAMKQYFIFINIGCWSYIKLVDVTRTTVFSYFHTATEEA